MEKIDKNRYYYFEDYICYDNDDYGVWGVTYYDAVEDAVHSTTYGHGTHYDPNNVFQEIWPALKSGELDSKKVLAALVRNIGTGLYNIDEDRDYPCLDYIGKKGLPVTIFKGRKMKGDARLVEWYKTYDRWGGVNDIVVVVYQKETNLLCHTSVKNIRIKKETLQTINEARKERLLNLPFDKISSYSHLMAYRMSYYSCDRDNFNYQIQQIAGVSHEEVFGPLEVPADARDPWEDARLLKRAKNYKDDYLDQMESLRNWADDKLANETEEYKQEKICKCLNRWLDKKNIPLNFMEQALLN